MISSSPEQAFRVAALYRFASLPDHEALRSELAAFCCERGIRGTLLLAAEGINGTVAGTPEAIEALIEHLGEKPALKGLEVKYSTASEMPFHRMKVRLKKEIVTMGQPKIKPSEQAGIYVAPDEWNQLISDPDVLVVDTRNSYETAIGKFRGATDPQTATFREFPAWAKALADRPATERPRKIAMYCTGGIRCSVNN